MNGETQEILKLLKETDLQKHKENLAKFDVIFKAIGNLQCGAHKERMEGISGTLKTHWAIFIVIFGSLGGMFWWIVGK